MPNPPSAEAIPQDITGFEEAGLGEAVAEYEIPFISGLSSTTTAEDVAQRLPLGELPDGVEITRDVFGSVYANTLRLSFRVWTNVPIAGNSDAHYLARPNTVAPVSTRQPEKVSKK